MSVSWIILSNLMSDVHSIVWDRVAMVHTKRPYKWFISNAQFLWFHFFFLLHFLTPVSSRERTIVLLLGINIQKHLGDNHKTVWLDCVCVRVEIKGWNKRKHKNGSRCGVVAVVVVVIFAVEQQRYGMVRLYKFDGMSISFWPNHHKSQHLQFW